MDGAWSFFNAQPHILEWNSASLHLSPPANTGWARGAAITGFIVAPAVLLSGILANAAETNEAGIAIGATGTVLLAITVPVVAAGGSSARHGSSAEGLSGMRIAAWVCYSLALADAATLIALAANDVEVPGVPISVGAIGGFSCLAIALDANASARQASSAGNFRKTVKPTLTWMRSDNKL